LINRKKFLRISALSIPVIAGLKSLKANAFTKKSPLVISTWKFGFDANTKAWETLSTNGSALDAVEKGVNLTEASHNLSVGLDALPDRTGHVTLDACIMDEKGRAGSVAFLERIKHPVSVARKVMETTPHVMLVGSGAQEFALKNGFKLEKDKLSAEAKKNYMQWKEKQKVLQKQGRENNHDTIGMLAMDSNDNLSGSCTTSGLAYKLRGRVGDSPIIGAGLFVDNEIGAATATGVGEMVIRICGAHTVVELMRQGYSPKEACKMAVERLAKKMPDLSKENQVGFLAINKLGEYGAFSLHKNFHYAVCDSEKGNRIEEAEFYFTE
jgi:N4-(beta-N-acetylglucosaminyl)-L-asparaginase